MYNNYCDRVYDSMYDPDYSKLYEQEIKKKEILRQSKLELQASLKALAMIVGLSPNKHEPDLQEALNFAYEVLLRTT